MKKIMALLLATMMLLMSVAALAEGPSVTNELKVVTESNVVVVLDEDEATTAVLDEIVEATNEVFEAVDETTSENLEETLTSVSFSETTAKEAKKVADELVEEVLKAAGKSTDAKKYTVTAVEKAEVKVKAAEQTGKKTEVKLQPTKKFSADKPVFVSLKGFGNNSDAEFIVKATVDEEGNIVFELDDETIAALGDASAVQVVVYEIEIAD